MDCLRRSPSPPLVQVCHLQVCHHRVIIQEGGDSRRRSRSSRRAIDRSSTADSRQPASAAAAAGTRADATTHSSATVYIHDYITLVAASGGTASLTPTDLPTAQPASHTGRHEEEPRG
eukprot:GHVU01126777.1.p1 GENE.GHVU01126777.1~~GHVU01126777.1.p1  ORF type:complete len:118 (+),score=12.77 GHVU01126777.1:397-750(+)